MTSHRGKVFRLGANRVWRTYTGGRLLDKIERRPNPADGPFPEDWIGSTVRAINPVPTHENEGLARVTVDGREVLLADLVAADPEYFFGAGHVAAYGANPRVLVKYLDAAVRLPLQVHPTVAFSRARLNADAGKTEGYYVLATRPEIAEPSIYLGFQRPPTRTELRRMIVEQDIAAMERCFDRIPVRAGDIFVVAGGLPHAIGAGVLMVEVMEPTDFVARVEFSCAGRTVPESARFMGRDVDFALDMFSFEPLSVADVQRRWRGEPRVVDPETAENPAREALVDARLTDRFRVMRSTVTGRKRWRSRGFTLLLVVEGACHIRAGGEELALRTYDRVLVPHGIQELEIEAPDRAVLLECLPPE